jgi:hypothetical protein
MRYDVSETIYSTAVTGRHDLKINTHQEMLLAYLNLKLESAILKEQRAAPQLLVKTPTTALVPVTPKSSFSHAGI